MRRATGVARILIPSRPRRGIGWLSGAAVVVVAVGACRDATGPRDVPALLERLSADSDEVPAGEILERPLRVRVRGTRGAGLPGIHVRFRVVSGPGSFGGGASEVVVQSTADGTAQATFIGGDVPGTASVQADVPAIAAVTPVDFSIRTTGTVSIALAAVSGDGQVAEVGSQLPLPFVVRATRLSDGGPAGGVRVDWSLTIDAPPDARLSTDFSFTAADGTARVLLTLGSEATDHRVRASSPVFTEVVTFTAFAAAAADGSVVLESVTPLPLVPGAQATLAGSGFGVSPEVRVEGEPATVVAATPTSITIVTPEFGSCLPARTVGVRVLAGGSQSNGLIVALSPDGASLDLALGERRIVSAGDAGCLLFPETGEEREYRVAVQSASTSPTSVTPVRLVVRSGPESGAGPAPALLPLAVRAGDGGLAFASQAELRIRNAALDALRVAGAPPRPRSRSGGSVPARRRSAAGG